MSYEATSNKQILTFAWLGFTLQETLVALLILSIISIYTIPKIISSQQSSNKKAIFKEAFATLSQVIYMGTITGDLCGSGGPKAYFDRSLNYIKRCNTDTVTQGCWPGPHIPGDDEPNGYVLPGGAAMVDVEATACVAPDEGIAMDWNGVSGPNIEGQDKIFVNVFYKSSGLKKAGWIEAYPGYPASQALYEEIFK